MSVRTHKSLPRPTLQAIADEVGVSYMTVARVLSGKNKESWPSVAERADRIRKVAERMGYRLNAAARATVTGRFGAAAFVMRAEEWDYFPFDLVRGVCDTLAANDMHMVIARVPPEDIGKEQYGPKIVRELSVDGLLVHEAIDVAPQVTRMINRHGVPAVWINTKAEQDCVYPDEFEAVQRATRMLIEMGHRRLLFLDFRIRWKGPGKHYSIVDRFGGYRAAAEAAGLAARTVQDEFEEPTEARRLGPFGPSEGQRIDRCRAILQADDRPTAVVTPSPEAAGPMLSAAMQLGLRVPQDLSILTVNHEILTYPGLALSTLQVPMLRCGVEAVNLLQQRIEDPRRSFDPVAVPYDEIIGHTIAARANA